MENITVNIKAKMDMVTSDMEEITSQMEDLDWRVQECQNLVNDLEEIKDLLEKLGKALGSACLSSPLVSVRGFVVNKPCGFGETTSDSDSSCRFLGGSESGKHFCMKYEEIKDVGADISPAFGGGGSALNPIRLKLSRIQSPRKGGFFYPN